MAEPIGVTTPQLKQERRLKINSLMFNGETFYTQEVYDVVMNLTDETESEVWRSKPEVFWNTPKAILISNFTEKLIGAEQEDAGLYQSAINQLENEV